jgi:hypothetical protein
MIEGPRKREKGISMPRAPAALAGTTGARRMVTEAGEKTGSDSAVPHACAGDTTTRGGASP